MSLICHQSLYYRNKQQTHCGNSSNIAVYAQKIIANGRLLRLDKASSQNFKTISVKAQPLDRPPLTQMVRGTYRPLRAKRDTIPGGPLVYTVLFARPTPSPATNCLLQWYCSQPGVGQQRITESPVNIFLMWGFFSG